MGDAASICKLLVFVGPADSNGTDQAGLFLTIIPAFNVQLRSAGTPSIVLHALQQISAHISSATNHLSFVNPATQADTSRQDPAPLEPSRLEELLNALWFSSLVLSLSVASISMMVRK